MPRVRPRVEAGGCSAQSPTWAQAHIKLEETSAGAGAWADGGWGGGCPPCDGAGWRGHGFTRGGVGAAGQGAHDCRGSTQCARDPAPIQRKRDGLRVCGGRPAAHRNPCRQPRRAAGRPVLRHTVAVLTGSQTCGPARPRVFWTCNKRVARRRATPGSHPKLVTQES